MAREGVHIVQAHLLGAQLLEAVAERAWYMAEARIVGIPEAQACVLDALQPSSTCSLSPCQITG